MFEKIKRIAKWLINISGVVLTLLSLFFVYKKLTLYWTDVNFDLASLNHGLFLGLILVYSLLNILLVLSWWQILKFFDIKVPFGVSYFVYAKTQLAKYIPGNIFHLAGRQMIGLKVGMPKYRLAKSMLVELILLVASGALLSILMLTNYLNGYVIILIILLALVIIVFISRLSLFIFYALCGLLVFLFFTGLFFYIVLCQFDADIPFFKTISIYVFAWLLGFLVPGAPAGIGIREATLLNLLSDSVDETSLLSAVVICRIIATLADCLTFVSHYVVKPGTFNNNLLNN